MHALQRHGFGTAYFSYFVSTDYFASIVDRLAQRITRLAARGSYFIVAHSLGGVLTRAALVRLASGTRLPEYVFLLGSPMRSARLARALAANPAYRLITGDCGQLLASDARMESVGEVPGVAMIGIAGSKGIGLTARHFGTEPNDGVVALSEVSNNGLTTQVQLPVGHTFLPSSLRVARTILDWVKP